MNKHPNLSAYDDVESLKNFTQESFVSYCDEKLMQTSKHISFIKKNCVNKFWNGRICELGSGNSKLLYRLEMESLLRKGIGIEISKSRYEFAEKFKSYINSHRITNINKNIFDICPFKNLDLIIGVDIVLQLIAPLNINAEEKVFEWINKSLRPNGFVLFELWDFKHILQQINITNNNLQIWEEFSKNDPFEFVLARIHMDKNNDIVWEKTFLKRESKEKSTFTNILRPYSAEQIKLILKKYGFKSINCFYYWDEEGDVSQGEYIILAQKSE